VTRASLLAALLLASCTTEPEQSCPGGIVATLAFTGERTAAGQLGTGLDPDPALPDCAAAVGFPGSLPPFVASLAGDAVGPAGALCRADGAVLFGSRSAARWTLESTADGAVLGGCDPTCAARSRVVITGDLAAGPAGFSGGLVEQLSRTGGACGACVLPCAARHTLVGVPEGA
jgi:hypothetical protein